MDGAPVTVAAPKDQGSRTSSEARARRNTKEDVIRAAGRLFAQRGFHGTSMRDLGGELGLLGSSLYSHVGGKNELLVEVIRAGAAVFQGLADEVIASDGTPTAQMRALIGGHIHIVLEHQDEARTFLDEARFLPHEERAAIIAMRDRYEDAFRSVLDRGIATGEFAHAADSTLTAILILSVLNALVRWYRADGSRGPDAVAEHIINFVMEAIT